MALLLLERRQVRRREQEAVHRPPVRLEPAHLHRVRDGAVDQLPVAHVYDGRRVALRHPGIGWRLHEVMNGFAKATSERFKGTGHSAAYRDGAVPVSGGPR